MHEIPNTSDYRFSKNLVLARQDLKAEVAYIEKNIKA